MTITITNTTASPYVADNRLTTVDAVAQELDISSTGSSAFINNLIKRASFAIEKYVDRRFQQVNLTETLQANGSHSLVLSRRPIRSVTQVLFNGSTISSTTYEIDHREAGILFRPNGWTSTLYRYHNIEPISTNVCERDWSIQYTAGYILPNSIGYDSSTAQLPDDVEAACISTVKSWYLDRSHNPRVKSEEIGDAAETSFDIKQQDSLPPTVISLLSSWRSFDPL